MTRATILIADDERLIRWSLVERLTTEGYGTVEAESGRQTLARFDDNVELVLLDNRLGDTDGLQVLEARNSRDAACWRRRTAGPSGIRPVDGFNREFRNQVQDVAPEAIEAPRRHAWSGNVRELWNAVERAVLLSDGQRLAEGDFPDASSESRIVDRDHPAAGGNRPGSHRA